MMLHLTAGYATAAAAARLAAAGVDTPRLDAQVLLGHVLGVSRTWLLAHPEAVLSPDEATAFDELVTRRVARHPVAYLTGHREFYGLDFQVDAAVLVPRPETELLVERAIVLARAWHARAGAWPTVVDLGVGCGAIAVALAVSLPALPPIIAVDVSPAALAVARANATRCHVAGRIDFRPGDLLAPLDQPVDLVLANLPYIPTASIDTLAPEVRSEPRLALDGGPDGLDPFRRLFAQVPGRVTAGGALLLEIGADQGATLHALAAGLQPDSLTITPDLAGHDRLLEIHLRESPH